MFTDQPCHLPILDIQRDAILLQKSGLKHNAGSTCTQRKHNSPVRARIEEEDRCRRCYDGPIGAIKLEACGVSEERRWILGLMLGRLGRALRSEYDRCFLKLSPGPLCTNEP